MRSAVRWRPDHWLLIEDGRIVGVQAAGARRRLAARTTTRGRLILPGFIDTHVHSPQLDVIGSATAPSCSTGSSTYTFPAERAPRRPGAWPQAGAALFLDALLAHGTHRGGGLPHRAQGLGRRAVRRGAGSAACALIAGKVLMDRHAPDDLRDDVGAAPSATASS